MTLNKMEMMQSHWLMDVHLTLLADLRHLPELKVVEQHLRGDLDRAAAALMCSDQLTQH